MLGKYVVNDELYKSYAYKICNCNDLKNDLVNDMYIKLNDILTKNPDKEISKRFIFLMIRSIFIDGIRKNKEVLVDVMPDIEDKKDPVLCSRITMDEVLSGMRFFDREILLKTHENSLRKVADEVGVHYVSIHNTKQKALDKLHKICQEKKEVLGLGTPLKR